MAKGTKEMRYLFIALLFTLLIGCTNPVLTNTNKVSVLNSSWQIVKQDNLNSTKGIDSIDALKSEVDTYNSTHINDQWFIVQGDVPAIEESPLCNIYIVDKITHEVIHFSDGVGGQIYLRWENWPRSQFVGNKAGWQIDANAYQADMYVDVIPPAPIAIIETPEQLYAKYSLYIINNVGQIKFELHCTEIPEGWSGVPVQEYFRQMHNAYALELSNGINAPDGPWTLIQGQVYIAP
jgi:hypothetical protein